MQRLVRKCGLEMDERAATLKPVAEPSGPAVPATIGEYCALVLRRTFNRVRRVEVDGQGIRFHRARGSTQLIEWARVRSAELRVGPDSTPTLVIEGGTRSSEYLTGDEVIRRAVAELQRHHRDITVTWVAPSPGPA
jgi:hypothetical protein